MTPERERKLNRLAAVLFLIAAALALTAGLVDWWQGEGLSIRRIAPGVLMLAFGIGLLGRSGAKS
jgi:hypothetical protein